MSEKVSLFCIFCVYFYLRLKFLPFFGPHIGSIKHLKTFLATKHLNVTICKIHTSTCSAKINLEMYKDYGTCTVVWLHIIMGLVQITCISWNFVKLMQAENHLFLSNTCMFYAR